MIIEKFIYLLFIYNRLYLYLLSLLFIKNIKLLKLIKLESSNQNISTVYLYIEIIFCYIINKLITYILLIYDKINNFLNQSEDITYNIFTKLILYIYNRIYDLDKKLYDMLMNYIKDVIFKKIIAQIMEEMTKTNNISGVSGIDNILSNSMKMFDDLMKNTKFTTDTFGDKNDLNKLLSKVPLKNVVDTTFFCASDLSLDKSVPQTQTINNVKNDDIIQKLVNDIQTNKDIKKNNNLILSSLKDKLN